jgi:hypothetical protein
MLLRALELARTVGSRRVEAQLLFRLGESQRERLDLAEAERSYEAVLLLTRDTGDAVGEAYALYGLGRVQANLSRPGDARRTLRAGLALAQQYGGPFLTAQLHIALAEQHQVAGGNAPAIDHLHAATQLLARIGNHEWRTLAARRLDEVRLGAGTVPEQPVPPAAILTDATEAQ